MSFGPPRDGQHTFQRLDTNPRWHGHPRPRRRGSARHHGVPPDVRAGDARPRPLLARQRPERGPQTARRAGSPGSATGWSRSTSRAPRRTSCARTSTPSSAARPSEAVRFLPGHDQWVMGPGTKDVHVTPSSRRDLMTRKANPVIVGGVVLRDLGAEGRRAHGHLARRAAPTRRGHRAGGRATGRHPRPRPAPAADHHIIAPASMWVSVTAPSRCAPSLRVRSPNTRRRPW